MLRKSFAFVLCSVLVWASASAQQPAAAAEADPYVSLLRAAKAHLEGRDPRAAIADADQVIAHFEQVYAGSTKRVYGANGLAETLMYLTRASQAKTEAVVIAPTWGDAYYMKGFAWFELGRLDDAKDSLEHAVALSPSNSLYLAELAQLLAGLKDWEKARDLFVRAEEGASLSPPSEKDAALSRAWRGQAYVDVELHRLAEAAELYKKCLALNPADQRALRELQYVQALQSKAPQQ